MNHEIRHYLRAGLAAVVLVGCLSIPAWSQASDSGTGQQDAAQPLPDVDVVQPEPQQQAQPQQKQQAQPQPQPQPSYDPEPTGFPEDDFADAPTTEPNDSFPTAGNPLYGAQNSGGAAQRAYNGTIPPVNPRQIVPTNLENFSATASRIDANQITERQPKMINEALTKVPGVIIVNDDGNGHHGGIGIRGSAPRRARKVLVMEDGQPVNLALWIDPSVHYFAPIERIESIEVLRGAVVAHGPNNNFGVVNVRNLSPFGPNETVISSSIGFTRSKTGFFDEAKAEGEVPGTEDVRFGTNDTDISLRWHAHTRQTIGNVGLVFSYTGANVQGAWDTERLRFNDFYGAIGWKGVDQDLTVSVLHARQRDNYDESNLEGEELDPPAPGLPETIFGDVKHCKTCYAPGARNNTYNGDIWRAQITHNLYLDRDTTITSRLYAQHHRRDRYQIVGLESNPDGSAGGEAPIFFEGDDGLFNVAVGEDSMFGRLRTFRSIGVDVRGEWANRPFLGGMTQTIQAGVRYEYQDMTNRNFLGLDNQILTDGDEEGLTIFERNHDANAFSAFFQTDIKATSNFHIVPGVRFEYYRVNRQSRVVAEEEGEAEEFDEFADEEGLATEECDTETAGLNPVGGVGFGDDECLVIEGIDLNPTSRESIDQFHVLPAIRFAFTGIQNATIYGGYHRGMSTSVLRNEDFPYKDEIGDNFELGVRSRGTKGFLYNASIFHSRIKNFQVGTSFSVGSDSSFERADRVEISGVELAGRLNSKPFVGGDWNWFAEGNYSYARGRFKKFFDEDGNSLKGNDLPEVPFHNAAITLGVEKKSGWWRWNLSGTYTYRGDFFTDAANTIVDPEGEGEIGFVPDVWLLSARFNVEFGDTGASWFISGHNLTDEFYITDREDGIKPGLGRTIWTGMKYKF